MGRLSAIGSVASGGHFEVLTDGLGSLAPASRVGTFAFSLKAL